MLDSDLLRSCHFFGKLRNALAGITATKYAKVTLSLLLGAREEDK